jgi:hypothetical protein
LIHQAYCIQNPLSQAGYSESCWGLTASDDPDGYMVHEPASSRDNGTITPTAALASFPYTPEESMLALKHFYRELGDKTWDWMGFYDAFNQKRNWWATSYLAIDQGPIILMIENYRSQLLWDLFMSNPEIQPMLDAIGFTYAPNSVDPVQSVTDLSVYPNPSSADFTINLRISKNSLVNLDIYNLTGARVQNVINHEIYKPGRYFIEIEKNYMKPGIYLARLLVNDDNVKTFKLIVK